MQSRYHIGRGTHSSSRQNAAGASALALLPPANAPEIELLGVVLANAYIKNVPGRKTHQKDAELQAREFYRAHSATTMNQNKKPAAVYWRGVWSRGLRPYWCLKARG
jgi:hypothetical protein